MAPPNGVKGMRMPAVTVSRAIMLTCHDARLCTKGILRVRIICTMSVCESNPSTNHPDWNSD